MNDQAQRARRHDVGRRSDLVWHVWMHVSPAIEEVKEEKNVHVQFGGTRASAVTAGVFRTRSGERVWVRYMLEVVRRTGTAIGVDVVSFLPTDSFEPPNLPSRPGPA